MHLFVVSQLRDGRGDARVLSFYTRERGEIIDKVANVGQFGADGMQCVYAGGVRFTDREGALSFNIIR